MRNSACFLIGIDPGMTGAIAFVRRDNSGRIVYASVDDIPILATDYGNLVDIRRFENIVVPVRINYEVSLALFEEPFATYANGPAGRAGKRITTSAHTLKMSMINFGRLQACIDRYGIPWQTVTPRDWKAAMGLSSDKRLSLDLARATFPSCADQLQRMKDHDRAEALLLAEYAYWHEWLPKIN